MTTTNDMADRYEDVEPGEDSREQRSLQLVRTVGSPVTVGNRDKAERIREAMVDLQVVIDGCNAQPAAQFRDAVASLARHCSLFLRKMVLDDDRSARLLDVDTCTSAGIDFHRIRRVVGNRSTLNVVHYDITDGSIEITKLDDETLEPEASWSLPVGPQELKIDVEWPLPGMADWRKQPTKESPWKIQPEGLIDSKLRVGSDCNSWLGQQLVMFDNRGITLKDVIRVLVNTEAAHSPPTGRLNIPEGEVDRVRPRVVKDSEIHILSHIMVCGVRYSHAVVIQLAMYLYKQLIESSSLKQYEGPRGMPILNFIPANVFSPDQTWLQFGGGFQLSIGGTGQMISHKVRAPR